MNELVSIIMPSYKTAAFIKESRLMMQGLGIWKIKKIMGLHILEI